MSFEDVAKLPIWVAIPAVLWFSFALIVFGLLRREISGLLMSLVQRLKSGATVKLGVIEVGEIKSVPSVTHLMGGANPAVEEDTSGAREHDRHEYYERARGVMLVHKLFRSNEPNQVYDALIYLIPHGNASLAGVARVEYYFGRFWNSKVFCAVDRARGFPMLVSAYGPFLCAARIVFNDGYPTIVHRYIDFEMGAHAPIIQESPTDKRDAS